MSIDVNGWWNLIRIELRSLSPVEGEEAGKNDAVQHASGTPNQFEFTGCEGGGAGFRDNT